MPTPRTLLSLNHDVLREILAHLLLDTLRERNRAAVLRTCSLLHELGLPLLYRVMDLEWAPGRAERWKVLFGVEGVLAKGRTVEVGSFVHELKFRYHDLLHSEDLHKLEVSQLALDHCSSLSLPLVHGKSNRALSRIVSQLPVANLSISSSWTPQTTFPLHCFGEQLSNALGLHPQPLAWKNLERLTVSGILWSDPAGLYHKRISFSDWSFKVLAFETVAESSEGAEKAFALFLEPLQRGQQQRYGSSVTERDGEEFLPNVERIEFRIGGELAKEIEQKFRDDATRRKRRGLNEVESRILPLMVFVGEDGKDRRLLEE